MSYNSFNLLVNSSIHSELNLTQNNLLYGGTNYSCAICQHIVLSAGLLFYHKVN